MINLFKIVLILFISNSVFANNSLQVRWQKQGTSADDVNYIDFVLSTDAPIYGVQIDGEISKSWLKGVDTEKSLYVSLLEGQFFEPSKPSTITLHADKQTGSFSYITSLVRPADAVESNAVIFSMPVKPVPGILANLSLDNVKIGYQNGSTVIVNDIEIEALSIGEIPNSTNLEVILAGITFVVVLLILLLGFNRRKIASA